MEHWWTSSTSAPSQWRHYRRLVQPWIIHWSASERRLSIISLVDSYNWWLPLSFCRFSSTFRLEALIPLLDLVEHQFFHRGVSHKTDNWHHLCWMAAKKTKLTTSQACQTRWDCCLCSMQGTCRFRSYIHVKWYLMLFRDKTDNRWDPDAASSSKIDSNKGKMFDYLTVPSRSTDSIG